MNELEQAARRAAKRCQRRAHSCVGKEWIAVFEEAIASEFSPLQAECDKWQMAYEEASERAASIGKRLAEAERLLGLAIGRFECFKCDEDGSCKQHDTVYTDIDKFLAAKESGNG